MFVNGVVDAKLDWFCAGPCEHDKDRSTFVGIHGVDVPILASVMAMSAFHAVHRVHEEEARFVLVPVELLKDFVVRSPDGLNPRLKGEIHWAFEWESEHGRFSLDQIIDRMVHVGQVESAARAADEDGFIVLQSRGDAILPGGRRLSSRW